MTQDELTFLDLLLIITRRKKLVGVVTAICVGIALLVAFALPEEYTATVVILPPLGQSLRRSIPASPSTGKSGTVKETVSSVPRGKDLIGMYVSILKSQSVEDAVIRQYGLEAEYRAKSLADAREALENRSTIKGSTRDRLIRLSVTDRHPNRSAEIANGYVTQFKDVSQHVAITEAAQWRVTFEHRLAKAKAELEEAEEALRKTQLSSGAVQVNGQTRAMIDSAARLRAQLVAKEVQVDAMRSYWGDENLEVMQAQTELDDLRGQLKLVESNGQSPEGLFLPKGAVTETGLEYVRRLRDVRYDEAISEMLQRQLEVAKLDEAREGALIQVLDPAVAPEKRSYPTRGLMAMGGLVSGFMFGIMLALLQGGLARMQHFAPTKDKLDLLKMSLWSVGTARTKAEVKVKRAGSGAEEVQADGTARPEATGSGF